jgi:outer membrane protein assembly factor BamA
VLTRSYITTISNSVKSCQPVLRAKLKLVLVAVFFLTAYTNSNSQAYRVLYKDAVTDSIVQNNLLKDSFPSRDEASMFITGLPSILQNSGYLAASIDNVSYDSLAASVILYLGEQYRWTKIKTAHQDEALLQTLQWPQGSFAGTMNFESFRQWQQKILDHLEENGHPFGKVYLDSIGIEGQAVNALLKIDPGPVYKIDSIRVYGDARVSNDFLQRWLGIYNGSIYNSKKLRNVPRRLAELSFIQMENRPTVDYLGTGSVLNLYLKARKNSQVNALIGFLPNSNRADGEKKFLLTVDANILLRNALGSGETIGLIWQQLQAKSPRLNLLFDQPFIFKSSFGLNFSLDMYKRDSTFLNINMNLGTTYRIEDKQTASLFIQRRQSIVSGINEAAVLSSRRLPREADVSSINLGVGYGFNNTDYRFNPKKGSDLTITTSAGTKKIKRNNQIIDLKDPNDPLFKFESLYDTVKLKAYQFRVITGAAQYIPLGGQSTLKLGMNAGIYQSANYFRNELFQIGGFRLLRGFDEESQFVSQYAIGTVEYRLLTDVNSYFFAFVDGGIGKHLLDAKKDHNYIGAGVGLSFELKTTIVNMAVALGRRDDSPFNLRQPKVHLGFASYF